MYLSCHYRPRYCVEDAASRVTLPSELNWEYHFFLILFQLTPRKLEDEAFFALSTTGRGAGFKAESSAVGKFKGRPYGRT
mmetsp:Transcript_32101/g.110954  ORF Transcript_32101/g.110954 Transcript_32101/m.110954 type:complete len:80 (-) Transcript_32101:285-524(-)